MERESIKIISFATPLVKNGGGESILRDLSDFFKKNGINHHVVLASKSSELESDLKKLGAPCTSLGLQTIAITPSKIQYALHLIVLFVSYRKIKKTITSLRPTIIVVHGFPGSFLIGAYARMNKQHAKLIYVHHFLKSREQGLVKKVYSYILDSYDSIVAVSSLTKDSLNLCFPELAKKIMSIPNAVKYSEYVIAPDKNQIRATFGLPVGPMIALCVGRFTNFKNQDFLLQLYSRITQPSKHNWSLVFVGDGDTLQKNKDLANKLGISQNVYFLGQRSHQDVRKILSCSDIFLYPSKQEGFGIVIAEALASGLPTIIFENIAAKEFKPAVLVAKNENEFEKLTLSLLENKAARDTRGEAGRRLIKEELALEVVGRKWINLFESVLQ